MWEFKKELRRTVERLHPKNDILKSQEHGEIFQQGHCIYFDSGAFAKDKKHLYSMKSAMSSLSKVL